MCVCMLGGLILSQKQALFHGKISVVLCSPNVWNTVSKVLLTFK